MTRVSYHGYVPAIKGFLASLPTDHVPTVLEVGVDRGVTFVPLVAFLARTRPSFTVMGVDVIVQEQVSLVVANLDLTATQRAHLLQANSLDVLPKMVDQGLRFDVVLLDGDHNYHTVSQELRLLEGLVSPHSVIVVDDYDGRWSDRDLWYAERPGYETNVDVTRPVNTDKHGVRPAVDEWLASHPDWQKLQPIKGEPVVLTHA